MVQPPAGSPTVIGQAPEGVQSTYLFTYNLRVFSGHGPSMPSNTVGALLACLIAVHSDVGPGTHL